MDCGECGAANAAGVAICACCAAPFPAAPPPSAGDQFSNLLAGSGGTRDWSGMKPYYQVAFAELEKAGGAMTPRWNWASFLFGSFWYLFRGMPLKGIIFLVLTFVTGGFLGFFIAIYAGLYGTWDLYLLKAKGKQLW